jgi:hypothetical protein
MKVILLSTCLSFSALASVDINVNVTGITQYLLGEEQAISKIRFNVRLCQSTMPGDYVAVVEQRPDLQILTIQEAIGVDCVGPVETQEFEITTDRLRPHKPIRLANLLSVERVVEH